MPQDVEQGRGGHDETEGDMRVVVAEPKQPHPSELAEQRRGETRTSRNEERDEEDDVPELSERDDALIVFTYRERHGDVDEPRDQEGLPHIRSGWFLACGRQDGRRNQEGERDER